MIHLLAAPLGNEMGAVPVELAGQMAMGESGGRRSLRRVGLRQSCHRDKGVGSQEPSCYIAMNDPFISLNSLLHSLADSTSRKKFKDYLIFYLYLFSLILLY